MNFVSLDINQFLSFLTKFFVNFERNRTELIEYMTNYITWSFKGQRKEKNAGLASNFTKSMYYYQIWSSMTKNFWNFRRNHHQVVKSY